MKIETLNITVTSQGSIIPNEPGKNNPAERSWKARLKWKEFPLSFEFTSTTWKPIPYRHIIWMC